LSHVLRQKHAFKVSENKIVEKYNSGEATGGWRKLHNSELLTLYWSQNIKMIQSGMRWAGHVAGLCVITRRKPEEWR
jgi:hypothetical protein